MALAVRRVLLVESKEIISHIAATFGKDVTRFDLWKWSRWTVHPFPALKTKTGVKPRLCAWSDEVDNWCTARGWTTPT